MSEKIIRGTGIIFDLDVELFPDKYNEALFTAKNDATDAPLLFSHQKMRLFDAIRREEKKGKHFCIASLPDIYAINKKDERAYFKRFLKDNMIIVNTFVEYGSNWVKVTHNNNTLYQYPERIISSDFFRMRTLEKCLSSDRRLNDLCQLFGTSDTGMKMKDNLEDLTGVDAKNITLFPTLAYDPESPYCIRLEHNNDRLNIMLVETYCGGSTITVNRKIEGDSR